MLGGGGGGGHLNPLQVLGGVRPPPKLMCQVEVLGGVPRPPQLLVPSAGGGWGLMHTTHQYTTHGPRRDPGSRLLSHLVWATCIDMP